MQINQVYTQSKNFNGRARELLPQIKSFLEEIAAKHSKTKHLHLVHALVFSTDLTEKETLEINESLADIYRMSGFSVLGGDTSSGSELNIFISTIVY